MRKLTLIVVLLTSLPLLALAAKTEETENIASITVLASTSMTEAMAELVRDYSKLSNLTISVVYESPEELAQKIESGDPADLYITEAHDIMTRLKQQGLIDVYSLSNLVENRLVLIASVKNHLSKRFKSEVPLDLLLEGINERALLVMADPDTSPLGKTAKKVIAEMGHWREISPFIVRSGSSKQALYLIAKGNNVGIAYTTDATNNPEVKILATFPPERHDPVIYQAAAVAGPNMPLARRFLDYLKSHQAKRVFTKHGFVTE